MKEALNTVRNEEEDMDDNFIQRNRFDSLSSINSSSTTRSRRTEKTAVTMPFNEEIDLDLPYFTPTKYAGSLWKTGHSSFFFCFCVFLFGSYFPYMKKNYELYNVILLISHIAYLLSSFLEWFHFKRGCIGQGNLISNLKSNRDKSCKAKILRSEQGWKYFFSFFACIILIFGNFYLMKILNENEGKLINEPNNDFFIINLLALMIISLAQILKIETILIETKQYAIKNDLTNCLIEILIFFCSLSYGTSYLLNITYSYDNEYFETYYDILRIIGGCLALFSAICLFYRYYMSSYKDLNASDLSNITI